MQGSTSKPNDWHERVQVLRKLFVAFPHGTEEGALDYYAQGTLKLPLLTLAAAIQKASETLERRSPPPLATLLRLGMELRLSAMQSQAQRLEGPRPRLMTSDELEQCRLVTELGRAGWYWCCEWGAFVNKGWRTAEQLHGSGILLVGVTREQIHAAWGERCQAAPF